MERERKIERAKNKANERAGKMRGVSPRFFPLLRSLYFSLALFFARAPLSERLEQAIDYPAASQEERAVLIKAMLKARANGANDKVIGRNLFVNSAKYTINNVPPDLKEND